MSLFVLFQSAVSEFLDCGEYATATLVFVYVKSCPTSVNDPVEALFGNRVEAGEATVESLAELELIFLRTLHVDNVDRVVVRLRVHVSLQYWIGMLAQRVDEGVVHSLSPSVFD